MDTTQKRVKAALVWLVMAALCGLVGFLMVHHYASSRRPVERFAMVIDAGSTQTRSSLYRLVVGKNNLEDLALSGSAVGPNGLVSVKRLLKVQQIGNCVNGGPLALIADQAAADELVRRCLNQFAHQIKALDFIKSLQDEEEHEEDAEGQMSLVEADDVSKQLALMNHRVNSITHLHIGATAGMRALELSNSARAQEKLGWIERSVRASNHLLAEDNGPHINTGYVGMLSGSDEASLGWVSVNFICDALSAFEPTGPPRPESVHMKDDETAYQYGDSLSAGINAVSNHADLPHSVGTLELGGASAQMAFQVPKRLTKKQIQNISLLEEQMTLFDTHYKLATRSDLCLGMSQAVLRLNYVLLHKTFASSIKTYSGSSISLVNACLQKGSTVKLTGDEIRRIWQGACLEANNRLNTDLIRDDSAFRAFIAEKDFVQFLGSGDVDQCDALLGEIVQPSTCKRYFNLCPENKITMPPRHVPFVTISGYNHALKVLNLRPNNSTTLREFAEPVWTALDHSIATELGGYPVIYEELVQKTRQYCSTNVDELIRNFPKVTKQYQNIICLQLVYIRKLLVEFYQLKPPASWEQIRFLIFKPEGHSKQLTTLASGELTSNDVKPETQPDIGWTLGLLLNVTSHQLETDNQNDLYHHHGASPMYLVRTTIFLVVGCSLIAIMFLVVSAVQLGKANDEVEVPSNRSPRLSYNIGSLGYTISFPTNYNSINSDGSIQDADHDRLAASNRLDMFVSRR